MKPDESNAVKSYTQIIIGNNNCAGVESFNSTSDLELVSEYHKIKAELEKTKDVLDWAMAQIAIKDFIIKSIL